MGHGGRRSGRPLDGRVRPDSGGAALVVMADDFEVEATKAEMVRNGGKAEVYEMPAEAIEAVDEAVNEDKHIVADMPMETEIANWVARAKEAPRIITY